MTKVVRIENADTNVTKKVIVEVWEKNFVTGEYDLNRTEELISPTQLNTFTLWDGLELRIREQ
jgi:hypothetical protein